MLKLFNFPLSGNCYKVRLLLSLIGKEYVEVPVDFYPAREHKSEWFLRINPLGQLPVLDDNGFVLRESQAILAYLANLYDHSQTWYPVKDPTLIGEIGQWLAFAEAITATAAAARLAQGFFYDLPLNECQAGAHRLFRVLDEHLWFAERSGAGWLCRSPHPTIADIACFPYVMLSEEGGIPRQDYPAIRRWCDRVKRIDGFVPMSGIFTASSASGPENAGH